MPRRGDCVEICGDTAELWCSYGPATGSMGVTLIEARNLTVPLLLKVKGRGQAAASDTAAGWHHTGWNFLTDGVRSYHTAVVTESTVLRNLSARAIGSAVEGRVLWTSEPFRLGGPEGNGTGPLAILQQRLDHRRSVSLVGEHSRSNYERLSKSARAPAGRAIVAGMAAQLLHWSDWLWRSQLYVRDLQFMWECVETREGQDGNTHGSDGLPSGRTVGLPISQGRLFLFDPMAVGGDRELVRKQRLDLLSLVVYATLISRNQSHVLPSSLCSRCEAPCFARSGLPSALLVGVPVRALDALAMYGESDSAVAVAQHAVSELASLIRRRGVDAAAMPVLPPDEVAGSCLAAAGGGCNRSVASGNCASWPGMPHERQTVVRCSSAELPPLDVRQTLRARCPQQVPPA